MITSYFDIKFSPYKASCAIAGLMVCLAALAEFSFGNKLSEMAQPSAVAIFCSIILSTILCYFLLRRTAALVFFSSIPFAIVSVTFFSFLCLVAGVIPQRDSLSSICSRLGFTHITSSYAFYASGGLILFSLGLTICRRLKLRSRKDLCFLLNHIGLWIVLAGGFAGSRDLIRIQINLEEGKLSSTGVLPNSRSIRLPWLIKLNDFQMEEYPPEIAFFSLDATENTKKAKKTVKAKPNTGFSFGNWNIQIERVIINARQSNNEYEQSLTYPATTAVKVRAKNSSLEKQKEGWLTSPSSLAEAASLELDSSTKLSLLAPKPKSFSSNISIFTWAGERLYNQEISVNKPLKLGRWKLYQMGYNENDGKWSRNSVIDAIYDPWLPCVYTGIAFLFLGTLLLFFEVRLPASKRKEVV